MVWSWKTLVCRGFSVRQDRGRGEQPNHLGKPVTTDPTVRSQELGDELRTLRVGANCSLREAGRHIDASASKLSRIETGNSGADSEDIAALLVVYGVTGPKRRELLDLAREVERRGWWQRDRPDFPARQRTLVTLESRADRIVNFETVVVPGLLQTAEYTRAIMTGTGTISSSEAESRVELRARRRSLLRKRNPPELVSIIDEPVLHRAVGGDDVLGQQLWHLLHTAAIPQVSLRIVPRSAPTHAGLDGSFSLIYQGDSSVVFLENLTSSLFLEERAEIDAYEDAVKHLSNIALSEQQSLELIANLAQQSKEEASAR